MRTPEELRRKKEERNLTYAQLYTLSGVPVPTIQKVMSGATFAPRKSTLERLEKALFGEENGQDPLEQDFSSLKYDLTDQHPGGMVSEQAVLYTADEPYQKGNRIHIPKKPQGSYTVQDYESLPDEERYELIDGVLMRMESPSLLHQQLVVFLTISLSAAAREEDCDCLVLCSPCDVQLDGDNKTMVQPDLLVYCDEKKLTPKRGVGAPDLVIEVLSPTTRSKDQLLKRYKYERAGVREFWIVDPEYSQVIVYLFDKNGAAEKKYTMEDTVPIGICGGRHSVDFSKKTPGFIKRRGM